VTSITTLSMLYGTNVIRQDVFLMLLCSQVKAALFVDSRYAFPSFTIAAGKLLWRKFAIQSYTSNVPFLGSLGFTFGEAACFI
jgi:hypothetical protein